MSPSEIIKILKSGGIGVLPTDTIYGLVGSALSKKAIERIYKVRRRNPKKPFIILIGDLKDLQLFGIRLRKSEKALVQQIWPGPVSVILSCPLKKFFYLHRGTKTLAFRLPAKNSLRRFLKRTGPLVVPSANPEGLPVAKTIREAKKYFGDRVDFYLDAGRLDSRPSTLLSLKNGKIKVIRAGTVKIYG